MPAEADLKRTPLYDAHRALGARLTPFAGFEMPVQYAGIVEEHLAVRNAAGLFDVSHMGEVILTGPEALGAVQWIVTNDATGLYDGRAMYTVMCRPGGGIVDDLLVYRLAPDEFMLVINASNIEKDLAWIREQAERFDVTVTDASGDTALIALQGPATRDIMRSAAPELALDDLRYYHFARPDAFAGSRHPILSRTGYTGEYGVEIYCRPEEAPAVWDALLVAGRNDGLRPVGLGARDTLRLEAGLALYGNDIDESTNPLEAGLSWLVKFEKGDFCGRAALHEVRENGPDRKLVGFILDERGIPRHGYPLRSRGEVVGRVTSGTQSPLLNRGIGLGYVASGASVDAPGSSIEVEVRGRGLAAHVEKPPFHKK